MSDPTPSRSRARRALFAVPAVLVPVVPIVVALLLSGSAGSKASAPGSTGVFVPVTHKATPVSTHSTTDAIPTGPGTLVAGISRHTTLYARPGGARIGVLSARTNFGSPTFVSVVQRRGDWLGTMSTVAGNNRVGWVRRAAVSLSRDTWHLHVELTHHALLVYERGHEMRRFTIAVGKPTSPTPTGRFTVTDRLTTGDPGGPYGCCILALSAHAPHAIADWSGGSRIAIHSTPELDSIGLSVSHGCMRLSEAASEYLISHIPLGTPIEISSA